MTPKNLLIILICLLPAIFYAGNPTLPKGFEPAQKNSISFTENKGQVRGFDGSLQPEVKFVAGDRNTQVYLMSNGLTYQFKKIHYPEGYRRKTLTNPSGLLTLEELKNLPAQTRVETFRMDMVLLGANADATVTREGKSRDFENFYSRDVMDVHHYNRVTYHDIYPGVDWVIYNSQGVMKYDFVLAPGVDPSVIKMEFRHQESLVLNKDGSYTLGSSMGTVTEKAPVCLQDGKLIPAEFILENGTLRFRVGSYDPMQPLVIDPSLIWASYYGGNYDDEVNSCATDASGYIYIAGGTNSNTDIASGGHQNSLGGSTYDAFLAKFDGNGTRQWATYYGGLASDYGYSCVTDSWENVYLSGATESVNNIGAAGHQNSLAGGVDAFLVKFDYNGSRLWATYYGGTGYDWAWSCAVDPYDDVFIAGTTSSSGGIASGGHQLVYGGGNYDAFLVKFNSSGTRQWGTYYGGTGTEGGNVRSNSCATDFAGEVYLSGTTGSSGGIASAGHQNSFGGGTEDAFLAKFGSSGIRQWGTYYGGNGFEAAYDCVTDPSGNVFMCGLSNSPNNIAAGGHQNANAGAPYADAFLVKFSAGGQRQWGTYYGGYSGDVAYSCNTDASDNVYITGYTSSSSGIATGGLQPTYQGNGDAYLVRFNPSGVREWGFYHGGTYEDSGNACAVDIVGDVYMAGSSESYSGISGGSGAHQLWPHGGVEGFVGKFCGGTAPAQPGAIFGNSVVCAGSVQTYSVAADPDVVNYSWTGQGSNTVTGTNVFTVIPVVWGPPYITAVANGTCGSSQPVTFYMNVFNSPMVSVSSSAPVYCTGMQALLSASGANTYTWSGGTTGANYTVSPQVPTTYTVTGANSAGCAHTVTIAVIPDTTTVFNYTLNGLTANFSIRNQNCTTFEWDYGNGSGTKLNPNPVVTYAIPGTYGVCLKCNNLPGACVRCINITVPDSYSGGVGISETIIDGNVSIYPNPGNGRFVIATTTGSDASVINALGQTILKTRLAEGENILDLRDAVNGIYFVQLKVEGRSKTYKIVKE